MEIIHSKEESSKRKQSLRKEELDDLLRHTLAMTRFKDLELTTDLECLARHE